MRLKHFYWILFAALLTAVPVTAQDTPQVITAANIRQLQSVAHIDFADLPEEAGIVDKGWFEVGGRFLAMLNRANGIVFWDIETGYLKTASASCAAYDGQVGGFVDGSFQNESPVFVAAYILGNASYITYYPLHEFNVHNDTICDIPGIPLHVWTSGATYTWIELLPADSTLKPFVGMFIPPIPTDRGETRGIFSDEVLSGPENDPDSFLRIGRIEPPFAITVTRDALVKRWNLETGVVITQVQVGTLPAAGQLNANGRYLAWADQQFEALHLLDFETGEDRVIAPLQGTYIPFLLLSAEADVIIGVNVGLEPVVVAWKVVTGERIDLGEYRSCNRQPDMVRLSKDGTSLVIGCDTGLDIWRVGEK